MVTMRSSILVNSFSPALRLPRQFGPVTARPVSCTACFSSTRQPLAVLVLQLAEARGDDGGGARAGRCGVADHLHRETRRHQHQHMIGLFGEAGEILVAGHAPDRFALGVDREQPAFVLVLDQIVPDALGIVAGLVGGADQHDVTRVQHRMDAFDDVAGVRRRRPFFGLMRCGACLSVHGYPLTLLFPLAVAIEDERPRHDFLMIETFLLSTWLSVATRVACAAPFAPRTISRLAENSA